jgi:hypothetical protein
MIRPCVATTMCVLASLLLPRAAWTQTGDRGGTADDEAPLRIGGSFRTLVAAVKPVAVEQGPAPAAGGFDEALLRITLSGRPTERLAFEAHFVQSYTYSSVTSTVGPATVAGFGLVVGDTRYRAIDATADWLTKTRQAASLWADRLDVKIRLPRADITVGRQAITFGKTYLWNPLDEFLPFDARQFDRDYKPGVDAVRVDVPTGRFSGVNLVAAAGREIDASGAYRGGAAVLDATWYGSAMFARYYTTVRDWDLTTQAGKVYGGYEVGAGVVGEIRRVEVRGEATYLWARPGLPLPAPLSGPLVESHLSAVVGIGKRFQNTLSLELEHFHNGAGSRHDLDAALVRYGAGVALQLSREITGMTVGYEFTPIVIGSFAALHSWSDGSTRLQPMLTYSLSANMDLLGGGVVGIGRAPIADVFATHARSEFGSTPRAVFLEFKLFF